MTRLRILAVVLLVASGLAFTPGHASALTQCTIVPSSQYTSTRCDSTAGSVYYMQRAKHTCHTQFVTFAQYGYYVGVGGVSSAGPCGGTITNRQIVQS